MSQCVLCIHYVMLNSIFYHFLTLSKCYEVRILYTQTF